MIEHVGLYVTDVRGSRRFYKRALQPLALGVAIEAVGVEALCHSIA